MLRLLSILLEMSLYSVLLFAGVKLIKRILGKHISATVSFALWGLVILRLLIPVTLDLGIHIITVPAPYTAQTQQATPTDELPSQHTIVPDTNTDSPSGETTALFPAQNGQQNSMQRQAQTTNLPAAVLLIYLGGVLIMLWYQLHKWKQSMTALQQEISLPDAAMQERFATLKSRLRIQSKIQLYVHESLLFPALTMSLKPKVLLPRHMLQNMTPQQIDYALCHELMHYKRMDHIVCILTQGLRCIHWFNPISHMLYKNVVQDMELACDVMSTKQLNQNQKKQYLQTLIALSGAADTQFAIGMSMPRARVEIENRMRGVMMNPQKNRRIYGIVILAVTVMLLACFTTACQPATKTEPTNSPDTTLIYTLEMKNTESYMQPGDVPQKPAMLDYDAIMKIVSDTAAKIGEDLANRTIQIYHETGYDRDRYRIRILSLSESKPEFSISMDAETGQIYSIEYSYKKSEGSWPVEYEDIDFDAVHEIAFEYISKLVDSPIVSYHDNVEILNKENLLICVTIQVENGIYYNVGVTYPSLKFYHINEEQSTSHGIYQKK
ncbi:M56 family metallopeptidase [Eubacteriales bacterium OttesenSCG-928-N14]|nr:M56 family metallopeptidase [Eubacteriales bacterium OttesenSCG-928-N14]